MKDVKPKRVVVVMVNEFIALLKFITVFCVYKLPFFIVKNIFNINLPKIGIFMVLF